MPRTKTRVGGKEERQKKILKEFVCLEKERNTFVVKERRRKRDRVRNP